MKHDQRIEMALKDNPQIADLVHRLITAEEALADALADQIDAIIDPTSAMPILLRRAQEALTISEARYDRLMTRVAAIIFELEPDGTIVFVNDAVTTITGYGLAELQGRNWWTVFFPQDRAQEEAETLREQLQTGDVTRCEVTLAAKNGSPVTLELNSANVYSGEGTLQQILGLGVDVTQRKRAEREVGDYREHLEELVTQRTAELQTANETLQRERETLRTLIDSITDEVWFCDAQGKLALVNRRAAEEFGTAAPESPSQPVLDFASTLEFYHADGQLRTPEEAPLLRSLRGETLIEHDEILRHPRTGETRHRQVNSAPLRDRSGEIIGSVAVVRDITRHKLAEQERAELLRREQAARAEAEEANAFKLRFMAMLSHELRTPLASIKGFTSTLLAPDVHWEAQQIQEFVQIIDVEADRLTDLIEELMDISRIQAGVLAIQPEVTHLSPIVEVAQVNLKILAAQHKLSIRLPANIPAVMADKTRIAQVLTNLVGNATKHSPEGTPITLSARNGGRFVQIEVSDQGYGIPPEEREKVFEAFHQGPIKSVKGGVGLGLAICKGLIEAHGGRIWVKDQAAPGTTIAFTLPTAAREAAPPSGQPR